MNPSRARGASLLIALVACTSTPAQQPIQAPPSLAVAAAAEGVVMIPPEVLLEAPPLNESQRLIAKGSRVTVFCVGLEQLDSIEEPDPEDVRELIDYAGRYAGLLRTFEDSVVTPEGVPGGGRRIPLPDPVIQALRQQQAQMYAYQIRVNAASLGIHRSEVTPGLRSRLDTAFLQLVNSSFTTADRVLTEARARYCPTS